jgi:hypothetical protein
VHFKLYFERTTNTIGLSIFKKNGEAILIKEIINKSSSATTDTVKQFYMSLGKNYRAFIWLNNISIYTYDKMEITPQLTQKELKISLDSYLLSIYDIVNKSIYCSATFEDTEVTIK